MPDTPKIGDGGVSLTGPSFKHFNASLADSIQIDSIYFIAPSSVPGARGIKNKKAVFAAGQTGQPAASSRPLRAITVRAADGWAQYKY